MRGHGPSARGGGHVAARFLEGLGKVAGPVQSALALGPNSRRVGSVVWIHYIFPLLQDKVGPCAAQNKVLCDALRVREVSCPQKF